MSESLKFRREIAIDRNSTTNFPSQLEDATSGAFTQNREGERTCCIHALIGIHP